MTSLRTSPRWMTVLVVVGLFVACISAAGCRSKHKSQPPGPIVRKVELTGVERFEDKEFTAYLNLRPSPVISLGTPSYYVPGLEVVDRQRIEELYHAHGHYDVKVERFDVEVKRKDKPVRRQRAFVKIAVDEGPKSVIRKLDYEWVGPVDAKLDRKSAEARAGLAPGDDFGIPAILDGADKIQKFLASGGYAFATVTEHARVDRRRHLADVTFRIDPGPRKWVTKVVLEGLQRVPADLVHRETDFAVGEAFSPGLLSDVERQVYGMGVFRSATVDSGERTPGPDLVLRVRVQEAPMQRVKVGVGLGIDPIRWDQHVSGLYGHDNLFGRLYQLTLRAKVGYAELPAPYDPDQQHGPLALLDLELRKKGLLEKKLVWTESPGFELGLWQGYQFYAVTNRIGVSRFFTRYFELGLTYNNRFVDLFNISSSLNRNRTILGLDFRDPYFLAFLQLSPTIHLTDDLLKPTNGVRFGVTYDFASTYLGGQFDYQKVEPDFRAYYRPHNRIQLALRAEVGMIFPFGRNPGAPIDLKQYLGGASDVRGWGIRRLSPRVTLCDDDGKNCTQTPIGGRSSVQGSFEFRVRTWKDLWVATFFDTGDVREGQADFDLRGLMYSTGGGLRYDSEIGTFRLDVAGRLNEDARFPEPRRWAIHIAVGEAF